MGNNEITLIGKSQQETNYCYFFRCLKLVNLSIKIWVISCRVDNNSKKNRRETLTFGVCLLSSFAIYYCISLLFFLFKCICFLSFDVLLFFFFLSFSSFTYELNYDYLLFERRRRRRKKKEYHSIFKQKTRLFHL